VIKDYFRETSDWHLDEALSALSELTTDDLLDLKSVASALHLPTTTAELDNNLTARGYRLLAKVPRLPESVIESIVERFATLQKIMRASIDDLDDVKDVGSTRARAIKEGLSRLAETSILDRYS
jgi:diadenylate cyclase